MGANDKKGMTPDNIDQFVKIVEQGEQLAATLNIPVSVAVRHMLEVFAIVSSAVPPLSSPDENETIQ